MINQGYFTHTIENDTIYIQLKTQHISIKNITNFSDFILRSIPTVTNYNIVIDMQNLKSIDAISIKMFLNVLQINIDKKKYIHLYNLNEHVANTFNILELCKSPYIIIED